MVIIIKLNAIPHGPNSSLHDFSTLVAIDSPANNFCVGRSRCKIGKKVNEFEKWYGSPGVMFLLILLASIEISKATKIPRIVTRIAASLR